MCDQHIILQNHHQVKINTCYVRKFYLLSPAKMRMTSALYINYNVCKMHIIGKRKAKWMYNMYIFKYSSNNKPDPVRWKLFCKTMARLTPFFSLSTKEEIPFFLLGVRRVHQVATDILFSLLPLFIFQLQIYSSTQSEFISN